MKRFEMRVDPLTQEIYYAVPQRGYTLMQDPLLNKGSCFPREERAEFELTGLLAILPARSKISSRELMTTSRPNRLIWSATSP